ncbi:hypothetical protein [Sediminibacterium goheungense]|uniref:hypothetical protein n=1 Tax=Sediminibacterium goheungense TaxID=1086393 RepID=UPI0013C333C6|nr:hypothetical protein [Sediminibacterium goheungense]
MKTNFFFSLEMEIFSLLSFSFFIITNPKLAGPLGLFVLITIFQTVSFIGTSFMIAVFSFLLSLFIKNIKVKACLRLGYCTAAIACIGSIVLFSFSMFSDILSLLSLLVFLGLMVPVCIKWFTILLRNTKTTRKT